MTPPAHRLWQLIEPYHAISYFEPECAHAFEVLGLRGFWRGYFAGRAAPFGAIGAAPVVATFFGFKPAFVERALPSIWSIVTPEAAIEARIAGADAALQRMLGKEAWASKLAEAAHLARVAIEGTDVAARPLFAANTTLDWPVEPHLVLWHAATLIREHRGDGHIAALAVAGLHPCAAHITQVLANGAGLDSIKPYRGWDDDDWAIGTEQLRSRGWLDGDGNLTDAGRDGRSEIEAATDRLAGEPVDRLGPERTDELLTLLSPIVDVIVRNGTIRYPNPIGVPRPE